MNSSSDEEDVVEVASRTKKRKIRHFREKIGFGMLEGDFQDRFRFSRTGAEALLRRLGPELAKSNSNRIRDLEPWERLLLSLRFYACGAFYYTIGDCHGISKDAVCASVHLVTDVLVQKLLKEVVRFPSVPEELRQLSFQFHKNAKFPNVFGCVDGTLIKIKAPVGELESQFVDRKGDHSLNCMAVCGPRLEFLFVNSSWPGSVNDARVFRNSSLGAKLEDGWRPFPKAYLLGDSGYPLRDYLLTPTLTPNPSMAEQQYNKRHKKTRRLIECAFGVLKQRFQCLYSLRVNPQLAAKIFQACAILHNLLLTEFPEEVELDTVGDEGMILNKYGLEEEAQTDTEAADEKVNERAQGLIRQKEIVNLFD